jgi:hypothetical protein
MGRHRVSVTFSLSSKQVELLERLAQRTNIPKSVFVRKGVDAVLRKYRDLLQGAGPVTPPLTPDDDEEEVRR